jgi:hypothetical protein
MATTSTLHVVFTPSAAPDLRHALRKTAREDRVVCLFDCLSFGPINPPDSDPRAKWVEDELGYTGWDDVCGKSTSFWDQSISPAHRKIAWLSRRCTQEYTGFLEWLWRLGEQPFELVDLTDTTVVRRREDGTPAEPSRAMSVGLLTSHVILDNGLLDRAEEVAPVLRDHYRQLWARLRSENAPLRVLSEDGLVSAPITHFDPLLLSHANDQWQRAAKVIGRALMEFCETSLLQTGDLVLAARVSTLIDSGLLESRGTPFDIRHTEVRLPAGGSQQRH